MHLIVMTEAAQGCPAPEAPQDLKGLLERWNPLMTRLTPGWALSEQPEGLNTLAERAWARLVLGRDLEEQDDGRLPLAAWADVRAISGAGFKAGHAPAEPCARLTPFHGLVGSDRITLVPAAELRLGEDESRELFAAVQPLYASEGVSLEWRGPLDWRVHHENLRGLPCASLHRAEGDSVQRWQGCTPLSAARLMRRLQNEAQMVLHEHPVNQRRATAAALTVNSVWLDHAGAVGDLYAEPQGAELHQALNAVCTCALTEANTALQAWVDAALKPAAASEAEHTLVLCGRHGAQAFTMRRIPSGWRGAIERTLKRPPRTQPLQDWLQALDTAPTEPGNP